MANLHLVLYDGDRQIDSWGINPKWGALDVAEFTTEVGTDIYDYIRDLEEEDESHSDQKNRLRSPGTQTG